TSRQHPRRSTARPSSTHLSPTCKASASRTNRRPRRRRNESALGSPGRYLHGARDVRVHRHLGVGVAALSQARVRCAGQLAGRGRRRPAMSTFWSAWVIALIIVNLGITLFLFVWGILVKIPTLPDGTSGHVWAHGVLREGIHNLPRWWIVLSS